MSDPKRTGVWADVEGGDFVDKVSNMGIVVRERIKGKPAYCYSLVFYDDQGPNRYIPHPLPKAARPPEEVAYLLIKQAREFIASKSKKP